MILPDFILPSRAHQHWQYSGQDHPDRCHDKRHFRSYPHSIEYVYNSRGFRDSEWPSDLSNVAWCLGDSFTVGVGSPTAHTWPTLLSQALNRPSVNVSMDGASNDWMARRAVQILKAVSPEILILHWSYIERREHPNVDLNDEQRRLSHCPDEINTIDCLINFQQCVNFVEQNKGSTQVVHSMIPRGMSVPQLIDVQKCWANIAGPDWPQLVPENINDIPEFIINELKLHQAWDFVSEYYESQALLAEILNSVCWVGIAPQLDFARDGHHYDIKTATWVAQAICQALGR